MNDDLKQKLRALGLNDEQIEKLEAAGGGSVSEADLQLLTAQEIQSTTGCGLITAKKVHAALNPKAEIVGATASPGAVSGVDPNAELPEGKPPSAAEISGAATAMGLPPGIAEMLFYGNAMAGGAVGGDMDVTGLIPVQTLVAGYNPKQRNMFFMFMGQLESALGGVPIIVIDEDGSVNKLLTIEYIEGLQEGREPADDDIYYDSASQPHELIRVGVDAQSIYDADPLSPEKALQKSGIGIGRVNWHGVSLEVKQVAFFAVRTRELDPNSEADLNWLRDNVNPASRRTMFSSKAPKAIAAYREALRTGQLPMLRVMLTRSARRSETGKRRRSYQPRDLSGIGKYPGDDGDDSQGQNGGGGQRRVL